MKMNRHCPHCGGTNMPGDRFCGFCGVALVRAAASPQPGQPAYAPPASPPAPYAPQSLGGPSVAPPPPAPARAPAQPLAAAASVPPPAPAAPAVPTAPPPPVAQGSPALSGAAAAAPPSTLPYTCLVCGYILGPFDRVCSRCHTPRGQAVDPSSPVPGQMLNADPMAYACLNNSGTGAPAPPGVAGGFNPGAFFLTFFWACGMRITWLAILSLFITWPLSIYAGFAGNDLAWRNRRFESVEQFHAVQRVWAWWGVCGFAVAVAVITFVVIWSGQS